MTQAIDVQAIIEEWRRPGSGKERIRATAIMSVGDESTKWWLSYDSPDEDDDIYEMTAAEREDLGNLVTWIKEECPDIIDKGWTGSSYHLIL